MHVVFVCAYAHTPSWMWSHIGEDSIYEIISELSLLAAECVEEMKQNQGMKLDDNDKALGGGNV